MFAGYEQQDSQEFLTFLLDGLHEGLNEVYLATKEGKMFYLMIHTTHFIYSYMASGHVVKDKSDRKRVKPLLPPHGLLFLISSKGSFICIIPQTG